MSSFLFIFAILLYAVVLLILFAFGMNFLYLAFVTARKSASDPVAPPMPSKPLVSVQVPIFNELYVAERLIDSVSRFDWEPDQLEILVLDDSTDETRDIVAHAVERLQSQGINIQHIHRTDRTGFKVPFLVGRKFLGEHFAVDSSRTHTSEPACTTTTASAAVSQ